MALARALFVPTPEGGKPGELLDVHLVAHVTAALLPLVASLRRSLFRRRQAMMKGSGAIMNMKPTSPSPSPSSMFYLHEADVAHSHHFLEECSLCAKSLSGDIFMYRGDTPFCSEECRRQQIEMDRARHRRKKHAAAHAVSARKEHHRHDHHRQHQHQRAMGNAIPWNDAGFAARSPALRV